jgi:type I restriction enzyme S subunit
MSSEWYSTTIGDICSKVFSGGTPTSTNSTYYDGGTIPWLRTKEVNYGKIYETEEHITELGFESSSTKLVPVNSVIVAMYGNGDTAGRVAVNKVPVTTNQACCNLVVDTSKADYRFVYYFLMGQYKALVDLKNGGAQQNLNGQLIKAFPITLPAISEQVEISTILESLDDRITLLRETNTTLEAIAQALFKSWFVDFDPVHTKMQGLAPEGMDDATAALFPDNFEESELGLVPKGWSISAVANVAEIVKGKSYSSKDLVDKHTTALVTLKSFERGGGFRMDGFKPYSGTFKPTQVVIPGDLIVAYTDVTQAAELIGKPAIVVGIEEHGTLVASLDVGIVRPDFSVCGRQFLYGLFKTDSFQSHTLAHTSGTTVLHLSKDGVGSFQFVLPHAGLINVFEDIATELAERRQINSDQVRALRLLRDTLLPRLISGQLSLSEVTAETI